MLYQGLSGDISLLKFRRNILTDYSSDPARARRSDKYPTLIFGAIFLSIFILHLPLLRLPYFWDEAGYYVPAARDILLLHSFIPRTTVSNAHPPLVMAWVALWWKIAGFTPLVTRSAMLLASAFSLSGFFRLAERAANIQIALAATLCTAVYPVFFAQSSLAQVDLTSAGLIFWGLSEYVERRWLKAALWFSLAALAKETAIIAPLALAAWEAVGICAAKRRPLLWREKPAGQKIFQRLLPLFSLLMPILPLGVWYAYHYSRTGYVFGNPEFFRYNVAATMSPLRFFLALAIRLWEIGGYLHLWILTAAMLIAMWMLTPLRDLSEGKAVERTRIGITTQMTFYVVIAAYVVFMALIGGAVLARYMLPAVPLIILVSVATLWRRVRWWPWAVGFVALAFVAGWFWNPAYGFSPEDNLAYRDYVVLHEEAEHYLAARFPTAQVLTAWPASDELTRPWLGYVARSVKVVRLEDFSLDEVMSAAEFSPRETGSPTSGSRPEAALLFSTKYEPRPQPWDRWKWWNDAKSRFFGFHRDLPPAAAAQILGGHIVFSEQRPGQWVAVIEMDRPEMENATRDSKKSILALR